MHCTPPKLILASQSPRRQDYLASLGLDFTIQSADIDESVLKNERPLPYTRRVARLKAAKIAAENPGCAVLAADTPVYVGRHINQTPQTPDEERAMLQSQSGRTVHVPTVVILHMPDGTIHEVINRNWMKIKDLSPEEIEFFVENENLWRGVSGGMQFEETETQKCVIAMSGTLSGIKGLPLYETCQMLKKVGYDV